MRRNLTHEVMREVDAPANWMMNGEYGSEFGAFSPSEVRFTPAHERFPRHYVRRGEVSQLWMLVLVNGGGRPFAVVQGATYLHACRDQSHAGARRDT